MCEGDGGKDRVSVCVVYRKIKVERLIKKKQREWVSMKECVGVCVCEREREREMEYMCLHDIGRLGSDPIKHFYCKYYVTLILKHFNWLKIWSNHSECFKTSVA